MDLGKLVNLARQSGYDHVITSTGPKPYFARAYGGKLDSAGRSWQGPRRQTPVEAAQDYCDHVNGVTAVAPATLKTAGHAYNIENTERDPEVEAALGVLRDAKAQREGKQGYIYLIVEGMSRRPVFGKIGYSVNPEKRVAELQTGNPRALRILAKKKGTTAEEKALHMKHIGRNVLQEWFFVTPEIVKDFK